MIDRIPSLAFKVPKGFEDVALADVKPFLPTEGCQLTHRLQSGFIQADLDTSEALDACLSVYASGELWSVLQLFLLNSAEPVAVPEEILAALEKDRKALPSRNSRRKPEEPSNSGHRRKPNSRRVAPLPSDLSGPTDGERLFCDFLSDTVKTQKQLFQRNVSTCLASFKDGRTIDSWAVAFHRGSMQMPTQRSSTFARHIADDLGPLLYSTIRRDNIPVKLENPHLEITVEVHRFNDLWTLSSSISLPGPAQRPEHRSTKRLHGRTTMLPERAYTLSLLHPHLRGAQGDRLAQQTQIFFDPCCGRGSIPLEIAAIAKRRRANIIVLGADNELPALLDADQNYKSSALGRTQGLSGMDAGFLWDGHGSPASSGLREGVVDGVVSDLPWGVRELSGKAVNRLYPRILKVLAFACVDNAYAVLLCQRDTIMLSAIKQCSSVWELVERRTVDVQKIPVHAFTLKRKTRSSSEERSPCT